MLDILCALALYITCCWIVLHDWRKDFDVLLGEFLCICIVFWVAAPFVLLSKLNMGRSVVLMRYEEKL